ncbi:MauE/DoxX family redox-associated membrane protein [Evansella clarkii]|jgi:hypothetical protein|uniref:MauE/DoxX family redox-associated membrane protein n=1 Tax=Evansella clarkii TaxID=79879 RepID=UPI000996D9AB|nr:MauE/DoxX family redox-associated membrane protein [Evansella clarkii]
MGEHFINILIIHTASFFILTGTAKLFSLKQFLLYTADFQILPRPLSYAAGSLIPILEIGGGFLLLNYGWWNMGAAILLVLLTLFGFSLLKIINSGRKIRCGCYGKWLAAEADIFSLGKAIYFFFLLLLVSASVPSTGIHLSIPAIVTGFLLTLLVIAAQKMWQLYQQNKQQLQNKR